MKSFTLYARDGEEKTAFIEVDNPTNMSYARLFYSYDNQNFTLVLNGATGITTSGLVINLPASVVTGVPIVYCYVEMSPDGSDYTRVAEGLVRIVESQIGTISGAVSVDNFPSSYPLPTSQYSTLSNHLQTISSNTMNMSAGLTDAELRAAPVGVDITEPVRQTLIASLPYSQPVTGPVTDQVLVSISSGQRIRLIRNAGHIDPTAENVFPNITLKIGTTTVFRDRMEPGLPWSETVCFEGSLDEDLTISIDAAVTTYLNMRYEII